MAHQYSAAPSYGAQYQSTPYHSPFPPSAGPQSGSNTAGFQQMNTNSQSLQSPSNVSNNARYDTNAQVYPQPASLPFAPHFYPEFLKHFPPPPPPLPNSQFAAAPGTVAGFPHFPQDVGTPPHLMSQQTYSQFPQSSTPVNTLSSSQDQNAYGRTISSTEAENTSDTIRKPGSTVQNITSTAETSHMTVQPFDDPSNGYNIARMREQDSNKIVNTPQTKLERSRSHIAHVRNTDAKMQVQADSVKPVSQSDLRERAKAALLSLVPHNIRYSDFLAEGVNGPTLQQLYDELGLNWQPQEEKQGKHNSGSTTGTARRVPTPSEPSLNVDTGLSNSKAPQIVTSLPMPSSAINSSMERKDRIAQLLAAKAGKATASGVTSQSGSPTSMAERVQTPTQESGNHSQSSLHQQSRSTRNVAQAELARHKVEELKQDTVTKIPISEQGPPTSTNRRIVEDKRTASTVNFAPSQSIMLPTPIKEHLAEAGLASLIPGLFMTSTEVDDNNEPEDVSDSQNKEQSYREPVEALTENRVENSVHIVTTNPGRLSLKRPTPMDGSKESEQPEAKRHAAESETSRDASTDKDTGEEMFDDASEGEIIEDDPLPSDTQSFSVKDQPKTQDPDPTTKETSFDAIRRPIVDVEQRQNLKRKPSYTTSPNGSTVAVPTASHVQQAIVGPSAFKSSDQLARVDERTCQSPIALVKATPEQIAERAARLKADFLRQRALRQRQLQEGIPALDEEVVKTQDRLKEAREKLTQVQKEVQQHEESITRARESERQLLQEIETLEKQVSDGMTGQKQFSNELSELKQQTHKNSFQPESISVSPQNTSPNVEVRNSHSVLPGLSSELPEKLDSSEQHYNHNESRKPDARLSTEPDVETSLPITSHESKNLPTTQVRIEPGNIVEPIVKNGYIDESPPLLDGASEPNDSTNSLAQATEESDISDQAMEESDDESGDSPMSIDGESDYSASMSDSGSDDYEPAEPEVLHQPEQQTGSMEFEPNIETIPQQNRVVEQGNEEGDDYEPADDMSISSGSNTTSSSTKYQTHSDTNLPKQDHQIIGEPREPHSVTQISSVAEEARNDDQEKGLQLSEADTLTKTQNLSEDTNNSKEEQHILGEVEASAVHYVPYQSPLSGFKSYRFNPSFRDHIKDGYRSLTYSHKIDPTLPICPMELDGNACTDPECQNQHFGSMAMTDDKILVQMSSATDIKDKALRDQYLIGLKKVIAQLRLDGVKEFSDVAAALSRYRREWTAAHMSS